MELTYVQVPQREYLIDGHPAKTYGEWPGIKSNHWKGSLRVIRPNQTQRVFDETYAPVLGRRHFSAKPSVESKFIPGRKQFVDKRRRENIEDKPQGLKRINCNFTNSKIDFERKHFSPRFGINNDPEILHIRTFHPDGNCRSEKETPIEQELGIKKRIWTITEKRNGMKMRNPGDKQYKTSEQFTNFFKDGGLIVGSTNAINHNKTQSKKANIFYETLDLKVRVLDKNKIWNNKVKAENLNNDQNYVKTLGVWEKNTLNEYIPKMEDKKTGKEPPQKNEKIPTKANAPKGKGKKK